MEPRKLLDILHIAERLKDTTRHCTTTNRRQESVAEHSWRSALMAYFLRDEFPDVDIQKVILMCIVHDLGEAFTGDIPTFEKTSNDEANEENLLYSWINEMPSSYANELMQLFEEMNQRETKEAKLFKAIDKLEAVIQHNESPIDTWIPLEYELNKTYGNDIVTFSPYLQELRKEILSDTLQKIKEEGENN